MASELQAWLDTAEVSEAGDVRVPPHIIRGLMAKGVLDNWPDVRIEHDDNGRPYALQMGSPAVAAKFVEMLAKDAGMLEDTRPVVPSVEVHIHGVDVEALK